MKSRGWNAVFLIFIAGAFWDCASNEGRDVLRAIGGQFPRIAQPGQPLLARGERFFAGPSRASFEPGVDGSLWARTQDAALQAGDDGPRLRAQRLKTRLPATAAGALRIELETGPGGGFEQVWVEERLRGASATRAEVVDGRVIYAGAKRGLDRVYEVSAQRVEEYLRIADEGALAELVYEVEMGPGIADLVVDRSGFGLVALGADGRPVLKAPQPLGLDARGEPVRGASSRRAWGPTASRFAWRSSRPR